MPTGYLCWNKGKKGPLKGMHFLCHFQYLLISKEIQKWNQSRTSFQLQLGFLSSKLLSQLPPVNVICYCMQNSSLLCIKWHFANGKMIQKTHFAKQLDVTGLCICIREKLFWGGATKFARSLITKFMLVWEIKKNHSIFTP